jgi:hypothetical protein
LNTRHKGCLNRETAFNISTTSISGIDFT